MTEETEDLYPCVGVCMPDPDGYCQGCGRPPMDSPETQASKASPEKPEIPAAPNDIPK